MSPRTSKRSATSVRSTMRSMRAVVSVSVRLTQICVGILDSSAQKHESLSRSLERLTWPAPTSPEDPFRYRGGTPGARRYGW